MPSPKLARQVKEAHKRDLFAKPNVVGVGVGEKVSGGVKTGEVCVVVLVRQKIPAAGLEPEALVPQEVSGLKTDVVQVGELVALQERSDRWRPAPGGVSIGHYQITAGTLGCVVRDRTSGTRLILSNNHVMANSNNASPGDAILQPGPYDGGTVSTDTIAHLERFCPIDFNTAPADCNLANLYTSMGNTLARWLGSHHRLQAFQINPQAVNLVDAAVARPLNDSDILNEILEIGTVSGVIEATLGMAVRKSGRTTGFTTGTVIVINATVNVSYGPDLAATFENQLVATPMSQGGDSGSLVVAANASKAVGLLFAGSDQSTIFSPIQAVLDCLEVDL